MTHLQLKIRQHQTKLHACRLCPKMQPPVITGQPVASPILLVGQAPGVHEGRLGQPFAWTAGKTLFQWFAKIGLDEAAFRQLVYMAAVCRCFPGKNPKGGDRVPNREEIKNCQPWLQAELSLLKPHLIIPVGKLAIAQFLQVNKLQEVIGHLHPVTFADFDAELLPLPHPSGASTWHRTEPGKTLLAQAFEVLATHPVWQQIQAQSRHL